MKSFVAGFVILGAVVAGGSKARADVWTATNTWNANYENAFSEYIRKLSMDVFTQEGSPYKGIPTDCADAAYTLRTIFAYENRLPVQFTKDVVPDLTNTTTRFDDVAEGLPRLRKFIAYVNYNTNTQTLIGDSYAVALRRDLVRPGAMYLHPQSGSSTPLTYRSGHVYYLQDVASNGMIRYISSTVPAKTRRLNARYGIVFAPMTREGGYRIWKQPFTHARPGESDEQFQIGGWRPKSYRDTEIWSSWQRAVVRRLQVEPMRARDEFRAYVENIREMVRERRTAVMEGWNHYRRSYGSTRCMSEGDYKEYSTPTRDVRLQTELQYLKDAADKFAAEGGGSAQSLFAQQRFEVLPGADGNGPTVVDLNHLYTLFTTTTVLSISEPEHTPASRWGLTGQSWTCPHRAKAYAGHSDGAPARRTQAPTRNLWDDLFN